MTAHHSPVVQQLWDDWLKNKCDHSANRLVEHYKYLVNFHVERIGSHLPNSVSKDELISLGLFGLFDAITKFDVKRNLKFDTYASFRIRGAIMDGLRREDWLPRTLREQVKQIEETMATLEQQLNRAPTSEEVASELNISVDEVEETIQNSLFANVLSIDEQSKDEDKDEGIGYSIPDETFISPDAHVVTDEVKEDLIKAIKQLNDNEQLVISLFYQEELTLTEIGKILELSTSRISQIHKQAIFKLKRILDKINRM